MKYLKIFAIAFILMNALFFSVPLFLNQGFDVQYSKSLPIESKAQVFELLADFHKHVGWNPWFKPDTSITKTVSKPSRGLGASYTWSSEHSGEGKQVITQFIEGQLIQSDFDFGEMGQAQGSFSLKEHEGAIIVTWRFWGPASGYVGRYMAHFMDTMMLPIMKKGLDDLAVILKDLPDTSPMPSDGIHNRSNPVDSISVPVEL